jgi:putative FmdB family regulatory protein
MPTYEYQCQKCNHRFEVFQAITEKPVDKCPVCNGRVKRLISSGAGLIFKGSGFYITDYKKKESQSEKVKTKEKQSSETKNKKSDDTKSSEPKESKK